MFQGRNFVINKLFSIYKKLGDDELYDKKDRKLKINENLDGNETKGVDKFDTNMEGPINLESSGAEVKII